MDAKRRFCLFSLSLFRLPAQSISSRERERFFTENMPCTSAFLSLSLFPVLACLLQIALNIWKVKRKLEKRSFHFTSRRRCYFFACSLDSFSQFLSSLALRSHRWVERKYSKVSIVSTNLSDNSCLILFVIYPTKKSNGWRSRTERSSDLLRGRLRAENVEIEVRQIRQNVRPRRKQTTHSRLLRQSRITDTSRSVYGCWLPPTERDISQRSEKQILLFHQETSWSIAKGYHPSRCNHVRWSIDITGRSTICHGRWSTRNHRLHGSYVTHGGSLFI